MFVTGPLRKNKWLGHGVTATALGLTLHRYVKKSLNLTISILLAKLAKLAALLFQLIKEPGISPVLLVAYLSVMRCHITIYACAQRLDASLVFFYTIPI